MEEIDREFDVIFDTSLSIDPSSDLQSRSIKSSESQGKSEGKSEGELLVDHLRGGVESLLVEDAGGVIATEVLQVKSGDRRALADSI